jgi:hypothetical protein
MIFAVRGNMRPRKKVPEKNNQPPVFQAADINGCLLLWKFVLHRICRV